MRNIDKEIVGGLAADNAVVLKGYLFELLSHDYEYAVACLSSVQIVYDMKIADINAYRVHSQIGIVLVKLYGVSEKGFLIEYTRKVVLADVGNRLVDFDFLD